ncbi:NAD(P)/FAD-dependent oxidoreductase [Flavobacteriaceae bacterium TP-CH-4]|uniref:NAD(P)/FAD-dependent oxidoreductase n=1 Tax=Pelagihabitans pacificus TaxID=2696054 RepID=A0A967AUK5_9FLAO|nr:NAD(P)/FAD-dependent oxidoreductase [Pelagihabitans pacificus]NHF60666.1 NAD(P)/FAD-dependent oxidoreductase [Pelagihabitans pacificus]
MFDVIVIGGGAAGFYAAIHIAEANSRLKVAILERGKEVLSKVKVSGGGRCNVTHAEFDPSELVKNYPRGQKELLGPFHTHCSGDTVAFFERRGISLKIEEDGRMFPVSDTSQTIIDCFLAEAGRFGVKVLKHSSVNDIRQVKDSSKVALWEVVSIKHSYTARKVLVATGSNPKIWKLLENLGHTIEPPTPSLFTFNIKDERINGIPGLSTKARVEILAKRIFNPKITIKLRSQKATETLMSAEGPVLVTHWGLSGPAILKLSAWGAKLLHDFNYRFKIRVNWLPDFNQGSVLPYLMEIKEVEARKTILRTKAVDVPRRLWTNLVRASGLEETTKWADVNKIQLQNLADQLTACEFQVDGKSTFKEEFVTAGGVDLKEINFKTMESKLLPNLYLAGEVINVDAITGGFNFQNAWTSGYIAAKAIIEK